MQSYVASLSCHDPTSITRHMLFKLESFELFTCVLKWKDFLVHIYHINRFAHITQYHVFSVARASSGDIQMRYKDWNTLGEWLGGSFEESSAIPVFSAPRTLPPGDAIYVPSLSPLPIAIEPAVVSVIN